jgi:hypothetical protein
MCNRIYFGVVNVGLARGGVDGVDANLMSSLEGGR